MAGHVGFSYQSWFEFTEARIGAKPRAVVVAKPPEGVVFASFRADVFFNSGSLCGVF